MNLLVILWHTWTALFSSVPYGDPYVASMMLLVLGMAMGKVLRAVFSQ